MQCLLTVVQELRPAAISPEKKSQETTPAGRSIPMQEAEVSAHTRAAG